MTDHEKSRLERLETFVERLKLGSYFAKAADEGRKMVGQPLSSTDRDLTRAAIGKGEDTLAKAVSSFHDPDALLAYADTVISDATTMGVVSSYVSAGDMLNAKKTVLEATERTQVAKAAEVMGQAVGAGLEDDMATYDSRAGMSELTARFGALERMLSSLEARLSQLERRPQAAPVDDEQVVAKATGKRRKRTPVEEAEYLMAQVDNYVPDATTTGHLSSMIQAGQFREVRAALVGAKRAHEAARLAHERKTWG